MHVGQATRMPRTTAETWLEFSSEVLTVGMTEQELRERIGIRCYVERLVGTDAHEWAARNVADGVATRLACRDSRCCQSPHDSRRIFDVNEMKLKILPRRDVCDTIRILFRQLGHHLELLRVHAAKRDLDALHPGRIPHRVGALRDLLLERQRLGFSPIVALAVVVPLTIYAAPQPSFRKYLFVQLVLATKLNFGFERVDFLRQLCRNLAVKDLLPSRVTGSHRDLLQSYASIKAA